MRLTLVASFALLALVLAGCTGPTKALEIQQAGSSTVLPIAAAWAEEFGKGKRDVRFVVVGGGSGAGFQKFCRGEVTVADASRPIKDSETKDCLARGITPFPIEVAIDGLAVVVSKENTFLTNLTVQELNRIWTSNASKRATHWNQLRQDWPEQPIRLFGPGTDSGTYDYFVEVIVHPFDGKNATTTKEFQPNEDDNVLVQGVRSNPHALGYFGLAYATNNADTLRIVPIDEGKGEGPVEPTPANVESGKYRPLSRPLYMYTDGPPNGTLARYFEYGLGPEGQALVQEVGYIPLPLATRESQLARIRGD
jgi:phosphate transport system substrate-binding protein